MEYDIEGERGGLPRKGERETIRVEKGAVRETEGDGEGGSEKEGERKVHARFREGRKRGEPREASGRLNNIIGGVLTVPGRPRANSSPLPPAWSLSLVLFSLLPLSSSP